MSYTTEYSDGSYVADGKSHYTSGYGYGQADAEGNWRATWTVPLNAPTGTAKVIVPVQDDKDGRIDLLFKIVSQTGHCS